MKKTSRLLAIVLSILILAGFMTACNTEPGDVSDEESAVSSLESNEESADEGVNSSEDSVPGDVESDTEAESAAGNITAGATTTSATKKNTTTKTKATAATTAVPDKDIHANDKKDFKGREFIIASHWGPGYFPEYGKSEAGDDMLAHIEWIETTYNCVLKYKAATREQMITDFTAASLANSYYADIYEDQLWGAREFIRKGFMVPLDTLESMDLSLEKYIDSYSKLCEYDGHIYGTNFTSWKIPWFNQGAMLFNMDLLEKYNQPNPWDLIEKGEWTWDKFREICKACTKDNNGDGKPETWGLANRCIEGALISTGKDIITWDSRNKRWAFGYADTEVYAAIQMVSDMLHVDKSTAFGYESVNALYGVSDLFGKGKAAFVNLQDLEWIGYGDARRAWIQDMNDDFGLVPFPLAPTNKSGKYVATFTGNARVFMIPKTAKNAEDSAFIFDRWTQPLEGTNSNSWKESMLDNYFRGYEESFKYFEMMLANAKTTMEADLGHLQTIPWATTLDACIMEQKYTPAEAVAQEVEAYNAYLDMYVNSDPKMLKK